MSKYDYIKYKDEYKLRVLPQDNDFFRTYILENNSLNEELIRTPSQKKLLEAKNYLSGKVKEYKISSLQELKDKIERTRVLTYSVVDDAEATLIFETTNDRGKSLTNLEKTKSFLMYKTYLVSESPQNQLEIIQDRFAHIYRDYETIEGNVSEDAILQYHFIAFEKWKSSRGNKEYQRNVSSVKRRINDLIKSNEQEQATDFIDKYSRELKETYALMPSLILRPTDILIDVNALGRTANFYPLLIKSYKKDKTEKKRNFNKVAKLCEIMSFRMYGVRRYRSNTALESLYRFARDFNGDFSNLIRKFKSLLDEYCSESNFEDSLLSSSFYKTINSREILYLFWKYENYLRTNEQPLASELSYKEFSETDRRKKLSIEHIAPQNPANSQIVRDKTIIPEITEEFQESFLHNIGNLTFDPLSANISKSNSEFDIKNQKYFIRAPYKTQNELDTYLNPETNKWDSSSISNRARKILQFALDYWNYDSVT